MVRNLLIDVFLFYKISNINLSRLFKLIFLLLLNVLLDYSIYLSCSHVLLNFFREFVENAFVFDGYPQESLFEFFKGQSNVIILMILLIFSKVSEYFSHFVCLYNERSQLEDKAEVMPSLEGYFRVVFLLSNRMMTLHQ